MITNSATSITPTSTLSTFIESVDLLKRATVYLSGLSSDVQTLNETMITSWSKTLWVIFT